MNWTPTITNFTLHAPLVLTDETVIKDTYFKAAPEMAGKTMIEIYSSTGQNRLKGVRLKRVTIDCQGIAAAGIAAVDLEASSFEDLEVLSPTQTAVYLAGQDFAMEYVTFHGLTVWCLNTATGLILDSANGANVCFSRFMDLKIHTEAGRSLEIRDCDTCLFENCQFESVSGYAVLCAERGWNTWINVDPGIGKVHFDHPEKEHFVSWSTINGGVVPK